MLSKDDQAKGRRGEERWQGEISPLYLAGISQQRWQPERWQAEEEHGGGDDEQATMAPNPNPDPSSNPNEHKRAGRDEAPAAQP